MKQQWERLEAWLKTHNPSLPADLNPATTDAEMRAGAEARRNPA